MTFYTLVEAYEFYLDALERLEHDPSDEQAENDRLESCKALGIRQG